MEFPGRKDVWNAGLTAAAVAVFGWVGWVSLSLIELQKHTTNRFTNSDAATLRADITDVTTHIDKRLSLSEHDVSWVKTIMLSSHTGFVQEAPRPPGEELLSPPPAPEAAPVLDEETLRKYDLRGSR